MKKTKLLIGLIMFITLVIIYMPISNAASLTISTSNSEAKKGDIVTITINGNGITGKIGLSATGGTLDQSSVWVENSKATVNVTITGNEDVKIVATPIDISDSTSGDKVDVTATGVTIKVNSDISAPTPDDNDDNKDNNGTTTNPTPEQKKSNNANLVNLGINPNDFKGFKPGTTSYDVTVPNDVEKVTVYAKVQDSKAKITSGTGSQKLKVGKNTLNVEVTAEDGTKKTYTINVTREEEKVTTNETNTTPEETSKTEENNEPQENKTNSDLHKLEIAGYTLTPKFSPDIYEYTLKVNSDVSKLDIKTEGANDKINIEIAGNEDLVDGENTVTILVYNEETKQNTTYQIIVDKENINIEEINPTLNDAIKKANKVRYILLGILLFIVVAIILFVIVRRKFKKNDEMYDQYEYDEEDQERLNLDEEEEFFKRLNKQKNEEGIELSNGIIEEDKEKTEPNLSNSIIEEKQELENDEDEEEFFRTSKSRKRGKHF